MATKRASKRSVWHPSDISKASDEAARDTVKGPDAESIEVGARAIYNFRSRKARWDQAAAETRSAYRARMQELLNELAMHGFVVVATATPNKLNPTLTPAEARALKGASRTSTH